MSTDPSGPDPVESTATGADAVGTPPVAPAEPVTDAKAKGKKVLPAEPVTDAKAKGKKVLPAEPVTDAKAKGKKVLPAEPVAPPKPKPTLKGAVRKAMAEAKTMEELGKIVAGLRREELDQAQADIYQARRRIVAAGIPKA